MRDHPTEPEQSQKRQKTSNEATDETVITEGGATVGGQEPTQGADVAAAAPAEEVDEQALREAEVGITTFVSPELPGFEGVLKKRYTDFLVNEIVPSGEVLHLKSAELPELFKQALGDVVQAEKQDAETAKVEEKKEEEPKPAVEEPKEPEKEEAPEFEITPEDKTLLDDYFTTPIADEILALHAKALKAINARPSSLGRVRSPIITDRDLRTKIHQAIRRIFTGRLESSTDTDGCMVITALPPKRAKKQKQQKNRGGNGPSNPAKEIRGKLGWSELGGEYLHFTLYKENKDTMEVISFLARQMKMNPKGFAFAGTKDRRGVTTQRASVYRVHADRLAHVNRTLRNAMLGDFEYKPHGLELGDLNGNEFVITLRDCKFPEEQTGAAVSVERASEIVGKSLHDLRERGYFNYYGLQRFGTYATRTDQIGVRMLQGDFEGAVDAILDFNETLLGDIPAGQRVGSEDIERAKAIHTFKTTGKSHVALPLLPRKFSAESNIIRHLGKARNDFKGALQAIPRNLRLMYVHAYQSRVWNFAVGERWRLYGDKLVAGDLVLLRDIKDESKEGEGNASAEGAVETVDADGEVVILPAATDSAQSAADMFERARPLTAEEAASGKYSIFDMVLPLPGFDVVYPENEMKEFYKQFMGSEKGGGLDPYDMRRGWKDISLSGGYRKVLSRPGENLKFEVRKYTGDDEQFVKTDLERLREQQQQQQQSQGGAAAETAETETKKPTEAAANVKPENGNEKIAVILTIQLGTSQYATMALRELMKTGGVKTYKPNFGDGR